MGKKRELDKLGHSILRSLVVEALMEKKDLSFNVIKKITKIMSKAEDNDKFVYEKDILDKMTIDEMYDKFIGSKTSEEDNIKESISKNLGIDEDEIDVMKFEGEDAKELAEMLKIIKTLRDVKSKLEKMR